MHNTFGNKIHVEIFGGSHTKEIGISISGLPKDFSIEQSEFENDINRRRPGAKGTTSRVESDIPIVMRLVKGEVPNYYPYGTK